MSMSRGGGRGSRGGRGGSSHNSHNNAARGPTLPWSLQQQVGGGAPQSGGGRGAGGRGGRGGRGGNGGGSSSGMPVFSHRPAKRKEQRKAARQEKKHHRFEVQQQHAQQRHASSQQQQQAAGSKRKAGDASGALNPAKRQKQAPQPPERQQQQQQQQQAKAQHAPKQQPKAQQQQPAKLKNVSKPAAPAARARDNSISGVADGIAGSSKTMFYDLLAQQGVAAPIKGAATATAAAPASSLQAAFLQDLRTERELARKLKVKKGSKRSGPEDGLDDLLSGITQLLPDSLKRSAAADAAAGSDGDRSEGEGDEQQQPSSSAGGSEDSGGGGSELSDPFGFGPAEDESSEGDDDEGVGFGWGDNSGSEEGDGDMLQQEDDSETDADEGFDDGGSSEEGSGGSGLDSGSGSSGSGSDEDADAQLEEKQGAHKLQRGRRQAAAGSDSDSEQQQPAAAGAAVASATKYVPPALRRAQEAAAAAAAAAAGAGGGEGSLPLAVQRRITGLLNRLAEANLQSIVCDIIGVYETEGRRAVAEAVSAGLLAAVAEGPRATEQFAAVVAVFVAGLAASARAQDISARFLEHLARRLEQAYAAADGLACHNLIMLLAYCYSAGLVAADCMYSVLGELTRRFTESDVAMMLTLLNAVGLQLRGADPSSMKDFVLAVHGRAASAAGASGSGMSKRAEIMLELVMDIKNNRLREGKASKAAAAAAAAAGKKAGRGGAAAVLQPGLLKWLKQLGVDDVTLSNISWAKLVQPDKKGMWWHPAATDAAAGLLPGVLADTLGGTSAAAVAAAAAAAAAADAEEGVLPAASGVDGQAGGAVGAGQLLQLASGLRMTTDVRRAVFVAIMGSEDCAEACEKLLRLPLKGDQSREVVRVLVECCLQEARYNPYYGHLAARLAAVSKGYKVTLQYCLWDQWKAVTSTEPRRLLCLAGLVGQLLASCVLPLSSLKAIDFDAAGSWTSKETFLWRHTLQLLLSGFASDADCEAAFGRLASQQPLGALAKGLGSFLKLRVGPWVVAQGDAGAFKAEVVDRCLSRLARAEKLLLSSAAAVLAG